MSGKLSPARELPLFAGTFRSERASLQRRSGQVESSAKLAFTAHSLAPCELGAGLEANGDGGEAAVRRAGDGELLYEPLSYQFVVDLLADKTELTERFGRYYGQAHRAPLVVAAIKPATVR